MKSKLEEIKSPHYDEELVPDYILPDPFTFLNKQPVTRETWATRKFEIKNLFREFIYGEPPNLENHFEIKILREVKIPGMGNCKRRDMEIIFFNGEYSIPILLFLPSPKEKPAPAFIGLNFQGNHTVHADPSIDIPTSWVGDRPDLGSRGHKATSAGRGMHATCWPIEMILSRGYALITAQHSAVAPDDLDLYETGIQRFEKRSNQNHSVRAIALWAWAYSRLREVLMHMPEVDANKAISIGHSRLGKTSLWAAAEDEGFAASVSLQSGLNGAKLNRRCYGARFEHCLSKAPFWLVPKIQDYIGREFEFPVDQHLLLSIIAPRPVYVASAYDDRWCDPKGEFLACVAANPVYQFLGTLGLEETEMPQQNISIGNKIGYHIRPGGHCVLPIDWWHVLNFTDRHIMPNRDE